MAQGFILSPFQTYPNQAFQLSQPLSLLTVREMWTSKVRASFLKVYPRSGSTSCRFTARSLKEALLVDDKVVITVPYALKLVARQS